MLNPALKMSLGLLASVFFIFFSLPTSAGFEANNGSDDVDPASGAAWFLENGRVVRYCIDVAPDFFSVSSAPIDLASEVRTSLSTWLEALSAAGVHRRHPAELTLATTYLLEPACDGTQDLVFLFGVETEAVREWKARFSNPLGFAQRLSVDLKNGWSRGVVWLAKTGAHDANSPFPDWGRPWRLRAMLLHEMGHVFGSSHIPGTIMTENLPSLLRESDSPELFYRLKNIDHEFELAYYDQEFSVTGRFGENSIFTPVAPLFKRLTGENPIGPIKAMITAGLRREPTFLKISDSRRTWSFYLEFEDQTWMEAAHLPPTAIDFSGFAFRAIRLGPTGEILEASLHAARVTYYGSLLQAYTADGEQAMEIPIIMERNSLQHGFIRLLILDGVRSSVLFQSLPKAD